MHLRLARATITATLVVALLSASMFAPGPTAAPAVSAAPGGDDQVVAFVVRGVGNGHGRGLSQWGAYGRAVAGQSWQQILDAYYGGTSPGTRAQPHERIRLTGFDGATTIGVVSTVGAARWNGSAGDYSSMYATETGPNVFDVYGVVGALGCPGPADLTVPFVRLAKGAVSGEVRDMQLVLRHLGHDPQFVDGNFGVRTETAVQSFQTAQGLPATGIWDSAEATRAQSLVTAGPGSVAWQPVATGVIGPITFSTPVDQSTAAPGSVLGICTTEGAVRHYRGDLSLVDDAGGNRVVNDVDVENYLRGVLPREVSGAWGDAAGGAGMNALRAQAVAARSFGLAQARYSYAATCDTPSCQVYGGAASRSGPTGAGYVSVEQANTDAAVVQTVGQVRVNGAGGVVSTEFSASNGPRTAGGAFPSVDDPWDDTPGNPFHRWTRVIDADAVRAQYGLASANGVATRPAAGSPYDGIWANEVVLGEGKGTISAWDFRNTFGLRSPGFELIPVRRTVSGAASLAFIGDSVGAGVALAADSDFQVLTEGVFDSARYDAVANRRTVGGPVGDGVAAAASVPLGTDLVVVELGYNDEPSAMSGRIDAMMSALAARQVDTVLWVNVSQRRPEFVATNVALTAATARWSQLRVLDWQGRSAGTANDRWFDDGVHLTTSGSAEFSLWLRDSIVGLLAQGYTPPRPVVPGVPLRVPVSGSVGVPVSGVAGVALNVTAVGPVGPGFLRVWPCGSPEPETSSVNWVAAGAVEPNAVVVPVDASGEVCVSSLVASDVIVDVTGWFDSGLRAATGRVVDTRVTGSRVVPGVPLRVPVSGSVGVPVSGVAGVALNVTAVGPVGPGFLRVWPCGSPEPETSSVNWVAAGAVEPNAVVVPVDASGEVCVSSLVASDVIVDVTGWFDSGLRAATGRVVDTRVTGSRVVPGVPLRVPVSGSVGVPVSGVAGVALNVTAVGPVGPGFLRVWPCGSPEPETSSVNWVAAGAVEPNAVVVPVDASGEVCVSSLVASDVIVDVTGWFDSGLRAATGRVVDTRYGIGPRPGR